MRETRAVPRAIRIMGPESRGRIGQCVGGLSVAVVSGP